MNIGILKSSNLWWKDFIFLFHFQRGKNSMLQEQIDHLTDRVKTLQDTIQQKEREFELYKEQNATKPEMKLQSQISLMNLEKVFIFLTLKCS